MSIHLPVYGLFVFVLLMHVGKYNASNKDSEYYTKDYSTSHSILRKMKITHRII